MSSDVLRKQRLGTDRYRALSLAARGLLASLEAASPASPDPATLPVGPDGLLASVVELTGLTEADARPPLEELLERGEFAHDTERGLLVLRGYR